jgi:hypothetical protein
VTGTGAQHPDDALREIGETGRALVAGELDRLVHHVAQASWRPGAVLSDVRLVGLHVAGRILEASNRLTSAESHYARHAVLLAEWPTGTTLTAYLESAREVILHPESGVLLNYWQNRVWHVSFIRRSGALQGAGGAPWILVDYEVGPPGQSGIILTAFQVAAGPAHLTEDRFRRRYQRWLRSPR